MNNLQLQTQVRKWEKNLKSIFHQTVRKIRVSAPNRQSKIRKAEEDEKETVDKLEDIEKVISESCAETNIDLVVANLDHLSSTDGSANTNGMWKIKKKIFPKHAKSLPVGKKEGQSHRY